MLFKQSLILLFTVIVVSAFAADIEESDVGTLRSMLRTQEQCIPEFTAFTHKCSLYFSNVAQQCLRNKDAAALRVKEKSLKSLSKVMVETDETCKYISECDNENGDDGNVFGCVTDRSSSISVLMVNVSYEAMEMQRDHDQQMQNILSTMNLCTNTITWDMQSLENRAIREMGKCFRGEKYDLSLEVFDVAEPTTAAVAFVKRALAVSEKSNSHQETTKVTKKPQADTNENEHN